MRSSIRVMRTSIRVIQRSGEDRIHGGRCRPQANHTQISVRIATEQQPAPAARVVLLGLLASSLVPNPLPPGGGLSVTAAGARREDTRRKGVEAAKKRNVSLEERETGRGGRKSGEWMQGVWWQSVMDFDPATRLRSIERQASNYALAGDFHRPARGHTARCRRSPQRPTSAMRCSSGGISAERGQGSVELLVQRSGEG